MFDLYSKYKTILKLVINIYHLINLRNNENCLINGENYILLLSIIPKDIYIYIYRNKSKFSFGLWELLQYKFIF